jgi:hypothetical protein
MDFGNGHGAARHLGPVFRGPDAPTIGSAPAPALATTVASAGTDHRLMIGSTRRLGWVPPWWMVVSTATMSSSASEEMTPPVLELRS